MILPTLSQARDAGEIYYDQNQHNAFFFFGNSSEMLLSNCYLDVRRLGDLEQVPFHTGTCNFEFVDASKSRDIIRVKYENLPLAQPQLLQDLQAYLDDLKQNDQPNFLERIFTFRDMDYDYLESLVQELKEEPLSYKVLLRRDFQSLDTPQFFSKKITGELLEIFRSHLEPLREN